MASGHVNRANRPNIWLLRLTPQSEDSPCQPGAVHTWPISEVASLRFEVSLMGRSGLDLLTLSLSHFDPKRSCEGATYRGVSRGAGIARDTPHPRGRE
jgi:hypothetical protein